MATYTGESNVKKYLDYEGLVEVFKKIKEGYASKADFEALKEYVGDLSKKEGTIASALATAQTDIEELKELLGGEGAQSVADQIEAAINDLDVNEIGGTGKYIKAVKQEDGKIFATAEDLTAANVGATALGGTSYTATTVQGILGELKSAIDKVDEAAISVTSGNGITITNTETEHIIAVKVKDNDPYLEVTAAGVASKGIDTAISAAVGNAKTEILGDATEDGNTLGALEDRIEGLEELVGDDSVEDQIETALGELDFTGTTGSVITTVTQTDGKVTATGANLTSTGKTVTVNGLNLEVNIDGTTIVKGTDGELGVASSALTQYVGKDAVKVSTVDAEKNEKTISLEIASGDQVLTQSAAGLLANLELKYTKKTATDAGKIELIGKNNTVISTFDTADFTVDGFLDSVAFSTESGKENVLMFTWNTDAGKTATPIDLTKYIDTYTNGDGLNLTDKKFSVKVKTDDKYLTVDEDGVASKGIDEAITAAVNALDSTGGTQTVASGKHVAVEVVQTDGKITGVTVTESDIASAAELAQVKSDLESVSGSAISVSAGNGITITTADTVNTIAVNVDETSEEYLTVGADGLKLDGIDDAIETECEAVYDSIDRIDETDIAKAFAAALADEEEEEEEDDDDANG